MFMRRKDRKIDSNEYTMNNRIVSTGINDQISQFSSDWWVARVILNQVRIHGIDYHMGRTTTADY